MSGEEGAESGSEDMLNVGEDGEGGRESYEDDIVAIKA